MTRNTTFALVFLLALVALPLGPALAGTGPGNTVKYALDRVGPGSIEVALGQTVTVQATIRNDNATTETFSLVARTDRFTTASAVSPASVTLLPGETATISVDVTASTSHFTGTVEIRATPAVDTNQHRYVFAQLLVPVFVDLVLSDTLLSPTGQAVRGTVTVVDRAGQPAPGVPGTAQAFFVTPVASVPGGSTSFTTNATGIATFVLDGPVEHIPGSHRVTATAFPPGNLPASDSATYGVNPRLL